tara:strand:+ start:91 stop:1509 length:1419 start_codon:yes stop_codon:yes gene_type:complete
MATLEIGPSGNPVVEDDSDKVYGAAGTNPFNLSQGALAALGGSGNVQAAVELATALSSPEEKGIDSDLAALLYFTKMGELASKPGATLLGSAAGAGTAPAAYLMQESKAERDRKAKIGPLALQLATTLGKQGSVKKTAFTDTKTNAIEYYTPKEFNALSPEKLKTIVPYTRPERSTIKSTAVGTLAKYLTPEDAKKFVLGQGLPESSSNFQDVVNKFIAPNEGMIGKNITSGGVFLEVFPLAKRGEVINLQISPSKSAGKPRFSLYVEKRLPQIAKAGTTYNTTAREVIPRVQEALNLLKTGKVETGAFADLTLGLKKMFIQAFGLKDGKVQGLENLEATSNYLAPKMRAVGSGSTSDMEFRAYQKSVLSISNTPKSNYISLYAFKKMSENAVKLNQKEMELLTNDEVDSAAAVNKELNKIDSGIFEKYTGSRDDPEEFKSWHDKLPDGAVIINNNLFSDDDSPYVIKGWGQ